MALSSIYRLLFFVIFLALVCCKKDNPGPVKGGGVLTTSLSLSDEEKAILISINDQLIPIKSVSPLRPSELSSLEPLKGQQMIGIGTATYGSKELYQIQDKIIRYFIKEHGFGGIALEMDFAEAQYFNDYLLGLNNWSLDQIFKTNILTWPYRTEAFRDLLIWIRQFNQENGESIQIVGFDNRETIFSCQLIKSKLIDYLPFEVEEINQLFPGCAEIKLVNYHLYSDDQKSRSKQVVLDIRSYIQEHQSDILVNSSLERYEILFQLSNNLVWTEEVISVLSAAETYNLRESYMARNTTWFKDFIGKPILVLGHNQRVGYIRNDTQTGSLGFHLRNVLDEEYTIMATSTSLGSARVFDPLFGSKTIELGNLKYPSLNFYFHHARSPIFALFLHEVSSDNLLYNQIRNENPFLNLGLEFTGEIENHYEDIILTDYYDILLHIDVVQETELIF